MLMHGSRQIAWDHNIGLQLFSPLLLIYIIVTTVYNTALLEVLGDPVEIGFVCVLLCHTLWSLKRPLVQNLALRHCFGRVELFCKGLEIFACRNLLILH